MQTEGDREPPPHKNPPLCTQPGGGFTNSSKTRCCRTINCKIFVTFIIRKTKNQDFKNEKSKKTANDLLIAFIV